MSARLTGKVAVITGTGGGHGRAAALLFAQEGATVVGGDLKVDGAAQTVDLVRAVGGRISSTHPLDFSDPAAVEAWVTAVAAEHHKIDILYNNAGAATFAGVSEMPPEDWRSSVQNDLDLVYVVTRAVWPHMVAGGGGAIVNTGSITGINGITPIPGAFALAATKHGVIGMTRALACEGGPHGIRVNSISPGLIRTPATEDASDLFPTFIERQMIKRPGEPEDIAHAALFLVSDDASFITGENLVVDGGYTVA